MASEEIVSRAMALVGVPFRLHGRDPVFGLDCVGLASEALEAGGELGRVAQGYRLRTGDAAHVGALIRAAGLGRVECAGPGDLIVVRAGPGQLHLAIRVPDGIVHADAALRRVVHRPGAVPWPVVGCWRLENGGETHGDAGADGSGRADRRAAGRRDRGDAGAQL
ncbi:hypothetical protein GCM10023219_31790 [Stakelama sediminis]|uniref:Cell wall-associated NlpC family hydrolase n=1 Tax=Stakelama sediminis TaxID=463200 RepID=A0A840Z1M2_9SPHN|nr:cell wall-associated NlpC family hydrolase [Stakelama sediminis]